MKKTRWQKSAFVPALFSLFSLGFLTSQALAGPTISVDFLGRITSNTDNQTQLLPTDVAGVVPVDNWNSVDDYGIGLTPENGTTGNLTDDAGATTTVTLTFAAQDSWFNDTPRAAITNANSVMMQGILKANGPTGTQVSMIFSNVPEAQYDVYVYLSMNGDGVTCNVSDLDRLTTYYITEVHQFYDTNKFVQGTNTDPNGFRDTCSYVKLSNIGTYGRGDIGVLVTRIAGADGAGIGGLQLVNVGAAVANTNPPSFLQSPFNRRVVVGDSNVVLSVTTRGLIQSLQWMKNGAPIAGATDTSYTLPPIAAGDNGAQFTVVVTNNVAKVTSSPGVITIGQLVPVAGIKEQLWYGATRATVEDGSHDSLPPDRSPVYSLFESIIEQGDNFGERLSCIFIAPVSANYVWFITSDDDSDLFVSTDATPAKKTLVAQEVDWSNPLTWISNDGGTANNQLNQKRSDTWTDPNTATQPWSNGIPMVKGSQYYIEAVHHEGGGGDEVDVTYKLTTEPDPANGDHSRVVAFNTAPYPLGLDGAFIAVTNPPQNTTGIQSLTATFTIAAASGFVGDNSGLAPGLAYQWQSAPAGSSTFSDILGANSTSFTTPILKLTDNGTQYRVVLKANDATTNSPVGTLTVSPDTTPPLPATVNAVAADGLSMVLRFNELMDTNSANTASGYVVNPGAIVATNASLDSSGMLVTLLFGSKIPPNVTNVLTITGVKDLAGNPTAANTTISFSYQPVTYEADILFDGPVGYYRFEDATNSSVAHNSGTKGGDGAYYVGDEATVGAGGVSTNAAGDPGPQPPTFKGFEASNHSAHFSGSAGNGGNMEWVDTKNQFLQGVAAFSLEYWCKPIRTNSSYANLVDWGNRIGIVGQNDAVEYGFIDPGTIQIWTPNGGSLNTTYSFPDGEWHHVATIASGADIRTYYDGKLVGTGGGSAGGNYGMSPYNVHIGGGGVYDPGGNYFIGNIDEVAVFDKAIPAARIAEHYNAGKNGGVITISGAVTPNPGKLKLSITASGGSVSISWSPTGGTLQKTTQLQSNPNGIVWTDAGTANPTTVTVGSTPTFFRVKQ